MVQWRCCTYGTRLPSANNWTSLLPEMLQYVSRPITPLLHFYLILYLHLPLLFLLLLFSLSFSFSLCLFLSEGQLLLFQFFSPSEGERNFSTWRKRSGTDTNMVCRLTQASLKSPFSPPFLCLYPSPTFSSFLPISQ